MKVDAIYLSREKVGMFVVSFMLLALSAISYVPSPEQASLFVFVVAYVLFVLFGFFCSDWWRATNRSSIFFLCWHC